MSSPSASSQSSSSSKSRASLRADFGIEIDFERGSESPSRVFRAMSELIETFEQIDHALVESIDAKIEPIVVIEDIEAGSVKAWLSYVLRAIDDEALKKIDWKPAVGKYLVKAKYFILKFTENKTEIATKEQVVELERQLLGAAEETDVTHFPSYTTIDRQVLLGNLTKLNHALSYLKENDKAIYVTRDEDARMNASFSIVPEKLEELLTQETIDSTSEMILKVKKPDYLGESKWEFRHGTKPIMASITHSDWLKNFHDRKYDIRPGDSLRVMVVTSVHYGYDKEVVATHYEIVEVKDIIRFTPPTQMPLLPPS